jgi:hypothetical protein
MYEAIILHVLAADVSCHAAIIKNSYHRLHESPHPVAPGSKRITSWEWKLETIMAS